MSFVLYGAAPLVPVVAAAAFAFNFCIVMSNTHWESALQKFVPAGLLGRVTSVDYFGSFLVAPLAPFVGGLVLERSGPAAIFVGGGLLAAAYWVIATAVVRPGSRLDTASEPHKVDV